MDNFGKFEGNLQFQSGPGDRSFDNKLFSDVENFIADSKRQYKDFKETGGNIEEKVSLARSEAAKIVDRIADKLLTDPDEGEAKKSAQMMAQIISQQYFSIGSCGLDKVENLINRMDWTQWGLDSNKIDQTDKAGNEVRDNNETDRVNLLFKEFFSSYNLDPQVMMSAWRESIFPSVNDEYEQECGLKSEKQKDLVMYNLGALAGLEWIRPGAASTLLKDYGLANLARYPLESLVEQYDNRDNQDLPYGAVVSARQDYNGSSYAKKNIFEDLHDELGGRYLLRFMEAGGRFSVIRNLVSLDKRYGNNHKLSFAMFSGHGNEESIAFGDWAEKKSSAEVNISDVSEAKWLEKVKKFFVSNPTIILDACSCGKKGGLAKETAKKLNIEVLACDRISYGINSIETIEDGDSLRFEVSFQTEPSFLLKKLGNFLIDRKARKY